MSESAHPFLTFIIPTYNGAELVPDTLRCVLNQPRRDFEVIIAEDGSKDDTLAVVERFAAEDDRIRIDAHPNFGVGKNLNHAVDLARGQWLLYLDQDDAIPDVFYTDELVDFLQACQRHEVDVIVPARIKCDLGADVATMDFVPEHGLVDQFSAASWDIKYEHATLLYATENVRRYGIRFYEEWVEMESIYRHCGVYAARKCLFTNDFYFGIRHFHDEQITATWNYFKVIPIRIDAHYELCKWHEQTNPDDTENIRRAWEALEDMVVDYVIAAYRICGLGSDMDEALSKGKTPELLSHIPAQFDKTHRAILEQFGKARRHILKKRRPKLIQDAVEKADATRADWTHSYPYEAAPSIEKPVAEFQKDALGFPAVYTALREKYGLD